MGLRCAQWDCDSSSVSLHLSWSKEGVCVHLYVQVNHLTHWDEPLKYLVVVNLLFHSSKGIYSLRLSSIKWP